MKRRLSFLLALCLAFVMASPALALQATQDIEITYRGISITLDGQEIVPVDADGNSVEPFLYDGTTYLPVRGVANALSLDVAWDGTTNTVTLTSGGTPVAPLEAAKSTQGTATVSATYRDISIIIDGAVLVPTDAAGNVVEPFLIDGNTYLPVRAISEALGLNVSWDNATSTVALTTGAVAPQEPVQETPAEEPPVEQPPVQSTGVYVGSIDSDKYHIPGCRHAEKILPQNEIWFDTEEEAVAAGYSPCGTCKP